MTSTDWDRLAQRYPGAFDALAGLLAAAFDELGPVMFELVRLRVATVLGSPAEPTRSVRAAEAGLTDEKRAALPSWPTSPLYDDRERACLRFVEQFVIDASGISDADVAGVTTHLGAIGCHAFAQAVSVIETVQRACLTLGIDTAPPIDEFVTTGAST